MSAPWPEGHEREYGDEDWQGEWCASDEHDGEVHDGVVQYPQWPCDVVLAHTGDASREAFYEREAAEWLAWYRQTRRTADRRLVTREVRYLLRRR